MSKTATYPVTPAQIGNSRGYRVDAALFRDHPELREGDFEAAVIGAGVFLVRQRTATAGQARRAGDETDPVIGAYLAWTERAMTAQPELMRPMSDREFRLAEKLVAGIEVNLETDRLPDDFELP